jgi:hypothetical protein
MANKPNEQQAKEFDGFIRHWQRVLNLQDWLSACAWGYGQR